MHTTTRAVELARVVAWTSCLAVVTGTRALTPQGVPNPSPVPEQAPFGESDPRDHLGRAGDHIAAKPGETATWRCPVDKNDRLYATFILKGEKARYEVADLKGVTIQQVNRKESEMAPDALAIWFEIESPPECLIISLIASPSAPAELWSAIAFSNGIRIRLEHEPWSVSKPTDCLTIRAKMLSAEGKHLIGEKGEWSYCLRDPEGNLTLDVPMYDDGRHDDLDRNDGVFGARLCGERTKLAGHYGLSVRGLITLANRVVRRDINTGFNVESDGARFVGTPEVKVTDPDGDKLFNSLEFVFTLQIKQPGRYVVSGQLADTRGKQIARVTGKTGPVDPSRVQLVLSVPGDQISRRGLPGPWVLGNISLSREPSEYERIAAAADVRVEEFGPDSFELPAPPTIDSIRPNEGPAAGGDVVDIDGKGLLDVMHVTFGAHPARFEVQSDTSIRVTVPSRRGPPYPTEITVTITTRWGSVTLENGYSYW